MLLSNTAYEDFRKAVDCAEERLDLARAALAIASSNYPNLDIADYLSRIDRLAMEVAERVGDETNVYRSIAGLNDTLFRRHGYRGDRAEYFDPRNSFLNEVMERKKGIPITLSVLYMEVAQRIGFPLHGVGFPGHFLVKYMDDAQEIVIDPFNGGEIQGTATLENLLRRLYGGRATMHPDLLEPVTKKQTLRRMLNNLKLIYLGANDFVRGISIIDRLLILEPDSAEDLRDRGAIFLKLECFQQALDDFETYLRLVPDAEDASVVRKQAVRLRKQVRQIH
jgi:regulator of sirC expression with transglutaminase-like and TPR domain